MQVRDLGLLGGGHVRVVTWHLHRVLRLLAVLGGLTGCRVAYAGCHRVVPDLRVLDSGLRWP